MGRAALRPIQGNPGGCPGAGDKHIPQCTLSEDFVGLVCPHSKCGTLPPESCFFSLICSLGSFMGKCLLPGKQGWEGLPCSTHPGTGQEWDDGGADSGM